mmetsp:Transcript_75385/g.125686  ORF Transcript_75385/g.125686 Transcript_75385/m.125686 type:complete len:165 (-) Transcript_75385:111-605(-)
MFVVVASAAALSFFTYGKMEPKYEYYIEQYWCRIAAYGETEWAGTTLPPPTASFCAEWSKKPIAFPLIKDRIFADMCSDTRCRYSMVPKGMTLDSAPSQLMKDMWWEALEICEKKHPVELTRAELEACTDQVVKSRTTEEADSVLLTSSQCAVGSGIPAFKEEL